jgi:hypothetical protein
MLDIYHMCSEKKMEKSPRRMLLRRGDFTPLNSYRESSTLDKAVISAIKHVRSSSIDVEVVRLRQKIS